jgi:hypothetical protein
MSRFLDLFPQKVTDLLRRSNVIAAGPSRLAEVLDAAVSNANMHPPLLPYEIWAPGAETSFPAERQIRVSDLNVAIDPEGEVSLALVESSTGERVAVMDVGFLAMGSRSQLLQLLVKVFSHTKYVNHSLLASAADQAVADESKISEHVVCQPRVVFDGHLVLRRRGWLIGRDAIPERSTGESAASYFVRVNEWRCGLGMPPRVFATLSKTRPWDRKKNGPLTADAHKPQFISFDNWFTVDVFERMREKVQEPLLVEEMLPDPDMMWSVDGRRFATELIVQWSCNGV